MRWLAVAFSVWLALAAGAIAQTEKVLPATEADFAPLLQGCWSDDWHAQLTDGGEASQDTTVCFWTDGTLSFAYEHYAPGKIIDTRGSGSYDLKAGRLHLSAADGSLEWPFAGHRINCDAVIGPDSSLELANCTGDIADPASGTQTFYRAIEQGLIGCWKEYASMDELAPGLHRVVLPGDVEGVSWGIDPNSGEEITAALPYNGVCFDVGGVAQTVTVTLDKKLGGTGEYYFDGSRLFFQGTSWLFEDAEYVGCEAHVGTDSLALSDCWAGADGLDTDVTFVRAASL